MQGLAVASRTDTLLIGLKCLCQAGILLTAPPAVLALIDGRPAPATVVTGIAIAIPGAATATCLIGGFFPSARVTFRRRKEAKGRLARSIVRAFLVCGAILFPALLADDIITFVNG